MLALYFITLICSLVPRCTCIDNHNMSMLNSQIEETRMALSRILENESMKHAHHLEQLGNLLLCKRDHDRNSGFILKTEALRLFTNALELQKLNKNMKFRLHLQKGNLYSEIGSEKDANHAYETALSIARSQHEKALAMYHKGRSLGTFGHHHDAIALLV
eukprot:gene538-1030_t